MIRSKRTKPRRGRVVDKEYMDFVGSQPCCVSGEKSVTVHHVRRYGEQKNDRRTIPLVARLHMRTNEKPGEPCVERGKRVFEQHWGVEIEAMVAHYNELYEKGRQ